MIGVPGGWTRAWLRCALRAKRSAAGAPTSAVNRPNGSPPLNSQACYSGCPILCFYSWHLRGAAAKPCWRLGLTKESRPSHPHSSGSAAQPCSWQQLLLLC